MDEGVTNSGDGITVQFCKRSLASGQPDGASLAPPEHVSRCTKSCVN